MLNDCGLIAREDRPLFEAAWETARARHGIDFTFYLPGMIRLGQRRGRYPAVSLTGKGCELHCEHCKGRLLESMLQVSGPEDLIGMAKRLAGSGSFGVLLSGGSDRKGRLPWEKYYAAIRTIKEETSLFLSAHVGFPDRETCRRLKEAGIDQALIDVMGDEETASRIYHLGNLEPLENALDGILEYRLPLIPHLVSGLYYGKIRAEYRALEMILPYRPSALILVVLAPLEGTPLAQISPPSPYETARLLARARLMLPEAPIALGCERPRNKEGILTERLAILAGATRMAVWSEEAVWQAKALGLKPRFQATCCSLDFNRDLMLPEGSAERSF